MKIITMREAAGRKFKTSGTLMVVIGQSPQKALTVQDMRLRNKILDKIDAAIASGVENPTLTLEDAEHLHLRDAIMSFPWAMFDREILQILEDIDGAETKEMLSVVRG